jgi:hypothetical protein
VSDLLAQALANTRVEEDKVPAFSWVSRPMGARIDLQDKHALLDAMDAADR